jgi:uncharacterized protein YjbI with pentapeptide repeats
MMPATRRVASRLARALLLFITGLLVTSIGQVAQAACTDAPTPKVDWRRCYFDGASLPDRDLTGAMLRDASFVRTNLKAANLTKADGARAKFFAADLTGARLDGAALIDTDFSNAKLSGGSLVGADLRRSHFFKADLSGADLSGAKLDGADFFNANLSGALWIDGKRRCAAGSTGQCD